MRNTPGAHRIQQCPEDWTRWKAVTEGCQPRCLPSALIEFPYRKRTLEVPRRGENRVTHSDFGVVAPSDATRSAESESFRHGSGPGFARGEFEGGSLTVLAVDTHEPGMTERAGGQELACG